MPKPKLPALSLAGVVMSVLLEPPRALLERAFAAADAVEEGPEPRVDVVRDLGVPALARRRSLEAGDRPPGHRQLPPELAPFEEPALRPFEEPLPIFPPARRTARFTRAEREGAMVRCPPIRAAAMEGHRSFRDAEAPMDESVRVWVHRGPSCA